MSVGIELKEGLTLSQITTIAKVGLYLGEMVEVMGKETSKKAANRAADSYMKDKPLTVSDKKMALKTIDGMTADYENRRMPSRNSAGKRRKRSRWALRPLSRA